MPHTATDVTVAWTVYLSVRPSVVFVLSLQLSDWRLPTCQDMGSAVAFVRRIVYTAVAFMAQSQYQVREKSNCQYSNVYAEKFSTTTRFITTYALSIAS